MLVLCVWDDFSECSELIYFICLIVAWRLETAPSLSRNGTLCPNRCTLSVVYCKLSDQWTQTTGQWYLFLSYVVSKEKKR